MSAHSHLPPLHRCAEIRALEQAHADLGLMERAGLATATLARELLGEDGDSVLVVAGPGNNGGDALVAARHLQAHWLKVTLVLAGDPDQLPADARAAYDQWRASGGHCESTIPDRRYDLILDGLFGIGLTRTLEGYYADLIEVINTLPAPVLAIDIPSGLCADTGRVLGCAIRATHTLTFLGLKPGLYTLDGPDHAGMISSTDLGLTSDTTPDGHLLDMPPALPLPRMQNAHKGTFGSVGVLGGDHSMTGAALLAARAALLSGAGRIYVGLLDAHGPSVDLQQLELMLRTPKALLDLEHLSALAVGPGLGRSEHARGLLQRTLHVPGPLLLDADALHLLAATPEWHDDLRHRTTATIMTPHPGEAAALLGMSTAEIQADRIQSALSIAREYQAITVLKGCGSLIAMPDGRWFINTTGNPGMSSAGMGDILCGLICSLIAQGLTAEEATMLGVHLHGAAADALATDLGPVGLTASEVATAARTLLNHWIRTQA